MSSDIPLMASYVCRRCGLELKNKSNLLKHLRRINPCECVNEDISCEAYVEKLLEKPHNDKTYDCPHCSKRFNKWQNKSRHLKVCKSRPSAEELTILSLKQELDEMRGKMDILTKPCINNCDVHHNQINNNSDVHNTNIMIENFTINDFGHETISYIPHDLLTSWFARKDLLRLLEMLHGDKEYTANHNIRVKSQKRKQIEVREGNDWKIKDQDESLVECIQNGSRILCNHAERNKEDILTSELDDDEDEYYSIYRLFDELSHEDNCMKRPELKPLKQKLLALLCDITRALHSPKQC